MAKKIPTSRDRHPQAPQAEPGGLELALTPATDYENVEPPSGQALYGFSKQRNAENSSRWEVAQGNNDDPKEDQENKKKDTALYNFIMLEVLDDMNREIDERLAALSVEYDQTIQQIDRLNERNTEIAQIIGHVDTDMLSTAEEVKRLTALKYTCHRQSAELTSQIEIVDRELEADNVRFQERMSEEGVTPGQDKPADKALLDAAWDKHGDALAQTFKDRGLGEEFDVLRRHANGESITPEELKKAREAFAKAGESATPDILMAQYLKKTDPDSEFSKTLLSDRLLYLGKVQHVANLKAKIVDLQEDRIEEQLKRAQEKLKNLEEKKEALLNEQKQNDSKIKALEDRAEKIKQDIKILEKTKEKINSPDFKQKLEQGQVSNDEIKNIWKDIRLTSLNHKDSLTNLDINIPGGDFVSGGGFVSGDIYQKNQSPFQKSTEPAVSNGSGTTNMFNAAASNPLGGLSLMPPEKIELTSPAPGPNSQRQMSLSTPLQSS